MHKDLADGRRTLTDSMKMFRMGLEGGKPAPGAGGRAAGMVLQGRRLDHRRAGRAAALARLRPGRRRGAGDRRASTSSAPDGAPCRARLRARQRVLRPCDRAAELPLPRPFQAARMPRSGRSSWSATLPDDMSRHIAHPARRQDRCGRSRSSPARPTCRTPSPTSSTTTSSTRCSASRATCTCTIFGTATLIVRRRHQDRGRRRVRDRGRAVRPAPGQRDRRGRGALADGAGAIARRPARRHGAR